MNDDSIYPTCPKCNEGTLLPFFNSEGVNIYGCTQCEIKFGAKSSYGHRGTDGTAEKEVKGHVESYDIKYRK